MEKSTSTVLRGGEGGNVIPLPRPFRRGYQFGTILVNLESHKVVDLLPGREAETSAAWMGQQPDLMVVIVEVGMPKPRRLALHKPLSVRIASM